MSTMNAQRLIVVADVLTIKRRLKIYEVMRESDKPQYLRGALPQKSGGAE